MRIAIPALVAALLPLLGGCSADCGPVDKYNSLTYRVFANPVTVTLENERLTEAPDFWSYGVPANGVGEWQFRWGGAAIGPVTVVIDGQEFAGTGEQDPLECGQASLVFSGTYLDSLSEVEHAFNASMALNLWADGLSTGQLGAYLIWKESWSHPSSEVGTWSGTSHLTGEIISQGG